jgi:hypothetical protein
VTQVEPPDGFVEVEVGSPEPLRTFNAWCRAVIQMAVAHEELPAFLFVNGPAFEEPMHATYSLGGQPPKVAEVLEQLVPNWATASGGSQLGFAFALHRPSRVYLLTVDETGAIAQEARVTIDGIGRDLTNELERWRRLPLEGLPVTDWQRLLAQNAGYYDFTKFRCNTCLSVCPGDGDADGPCEYCGGTDIETVPLDTPLAPPIAPYNAALGS